MFFRPPKVKSLSRYAEYGAYLGNMHFLLMLAVAFTVHIGFIVIYSMTPSQNVIRIPVRVLNIKLTGEASDAALHMPAPSSMPGAMVPPSPSSQSEAGDEDMKSVAQENPESVADEELKAPERKASPRKHPEATAASGKTIRLPPQAKRAKSHSAEGTLSTPKRYVRESKVKQAAANIGGEAGGKDAIERYTQVISQWIQNHQGAARDAYKDAVQGQEHVQGQTVIRLRINRDGTIVSNTKDHTSGNELVDDIAQAMVAASSPVPSVPADYPSDSQLEFLITVQVDLSKQ